MMLGRGLRADALTLIKNSPNPSPNPVRKSWGNPPGRPFFIPNHPPYFFPFAILLGRDTMPI
jgi:hypothetical protein